MDQIKLSPKRQRGVSGEQSRCTRTDPSSLTVSELSWHPDGAEHEIGKCYKTLRHPDYGKCEVGLEMKYAG